MPGRIARVSDPKCSQDGVRPALHPEHARARQDPGRLHLRPAPRGYEWMQTPSGMALVQQGTGRVYDVVPY